MGAAGLTSTVESYLEAIFELEEVGERVTQARLARWFGVSAPATLEVVRRMERLRLVEVGRDRAIALTEQGRARAREMARRHRVIERFLVDVLGVPWHLADEEARRMEPGVSEVIFERMLAAVAGADRCPHGNPIPGELPFQTVALTPLDACPPGARVRLDRIREDLELNLGMLRYLEEQGLLPGAELVVAGRGPGGEVVVELGGRRVGVEGPLAGHVLCVPG